MPKRYGDPLTCEAFPAGIPDRILVDGFDHRKPFAGDNGIQFELAPDRKMNWKPNA